MGKDRPSRRDYRLPLIALMFVVVFVIGGCKQTTDDTNQIENEAQGTEEIDPTTNGEEAEAADGEGMMEQKDAMVKDDMMKANGDGAAPQSEGQAPPTAEEAAREITMTMVAQNNSGQSGHATLTDLGGRTRVSVRLNNPPRNQVQPIHIHAGSCNNLGGIRHVLNNVTGGVSETILDRPLEQMLDDLPLALNVHKSEQEMSTYVACANINNQ